MVSLRSRGPVEEQPEIKTQAKPKVASRRASVAAAAPKSPVKATTSAAAEATAKRPRKSVAKPEEPIKTTKK